MPTLQLTAHVLNPDFLPGNALTDCSLQELCSHFAGFLDAETTTPLAVQQLNTAIKALVDFEKQLILCKDSTRMEYDDKINKLKARLVQDISNLQPNGELWLSDGYWADGEWRSAIRYKLLRTTTQVQFCIYVQNALGTYQERAAYTIAWRNLPNELKDFADKLLRFPSKRVSEQETLDSVDKKLYYPWEKQEGKSTAIDAPIPALYREDELTKLRECMAVNPSSIFSAILQKTVKDILDLGEQGYLLLPGGWCEQSGKAARHVLIYRFRLVGEQLLFEIGNTGPDIKTHERRSATDLELYRPFKTYSMVRDGIDPTKLSQFVKALLEIQLSFRETIKYTGDYLTWIDQRSPLTDPFSVKHLYEKVLPAIAVINGRRLIAEAHDDYMPAHSASVQFLLNALLREAYGKSQEAEYQQSMYQFKFHTLAAWIRSFAPDTPLTTAAKWQLTNALNHLYKLLNNEIFTHAYREQAVSHIQGLESTISPLLQLPVPAVPVVRRDDTSAPEPQTAITMPRVTMSPYISSGRAVESVAAPSPMELDTTNFMVFLESLTNILQHCQDLASRNQHLEIIEQLETTFLQLPIPLHPGVINTVDEANKLFTIIYKLSYQQLTSYNLYMRSAVATPSILITNYSILCFIDQLYTQHPLTTKPAPSVFSTIVKQCNSRNNPFFASNDPALDARLVVIQGLYATPTPYLSDITGLYYTALLGDMPGVPELDAEPLDDLQKELRAKSINNKLYNFMNRYYKTSSEPKLQEAITRFNQQALVEQCIYNLVIGESPKPVMYDKLHLDSKLLPSYGTKKQEWSVTFHTILDSVPSRISTNPRPLDVTLPEHKYVGAPVALKVPYAEPRNTDDSEVMLNPTAKQPPDDQKYKTRTAVEYSTIHYPTGPNTTQEREWRILRQVPQFQLPLTLDYFTTNITTLRDKPAQIELEGNIFQPDLLRQALLADHALVDRIEQFCGTGIRFFSKLGLCSKGSLFFLRLQVLVTSYVASLPKEHGFENGLPALQTEITRLLQQPHPEIIAVNLHKLRFLTAMAHVKLGEATDAEFFSQVLHSYFYSKAKFSEPEDTATQFQWDRAEIIFRRLLVAKQELVTDPVLKSVITALGLGIELERYTIQSTYPNITLQPPADSTLATYQVNLERGLVFTGGLASSPIPADLLRHPMMQWLNLSGVTSCFQSSNGQLVLIKTATMQLRLITDNPQQPENWQLQREWEINDKRAWYQLCHATREQERNLAVKTQLIDGLEKTLPKTLIEPAVQAWVSDSCLLTRGDIPLYLGTSTSGPAIAFTQLDANSHTTGFVLDTTATEYMPFAQFEGREFVILVKDAHGALKVNFNRYGISLTQNLTIAGASCSAAASQPIMLDGHPTLALDMYGDSSMPGVAHLVFTDQQTKTKKLLLAIQPFRPSRQVHTTGYYSLFHDIHDLDIGEFSRDHWRYSKYPPQPRQYTNTARYLLLTMQEDGTPRPESASAALYLAYCYLATQQPEKTWGVLEDCINRLGGLAGHADELVYLSWIVTHITNRYIPHDIACQLKALSLLTQLHQQQGKALPLPEKPVANITLNDAYAAYCHKELQKFHDGLSAKINSLYSDYSRMVGSLPVSLHLDPTEEYSLLDYCVTHRTGDSRAVGTLEYARSKLQLEQLMIERARLISRQESDGSKFSSHSQRRLAEVNTRLTSAAIVVYAHKTKTRMVTIPLELPKNANQFMRKVVNPLGMTEYRDNQISFMEKISDYHKKNTIDELHLSMPELNFLDHLPYFFNIAAYHDHPQVAPELRTKLTEFCTQVIRANYEAPTPSKMAYACQVLYRILANPRSIRDENTKGVKKLSEMLIYARNLPSRTLPEIQAPSAYDDTTDVLATIPQIVATIPSVAVVLPMPVTILPAEELTAWKIAKLIGKCGDSDTALQTFYDEYRGISTKLIADLAALNPDVSGNEQLAGQLKLTAIADMQRLAENTFKQVALSTALLTQADILIASFNTDLNEEWQAIVRLANAGPDDPVAQLLHSNALRSGARAPLDKTQLFILYRRADRVEYRAATGLSNLKIDELDNIISSYLVHALQNQQVARVKKELTQLMSIPQEQVGETQHSQACYRVAQALCADNLVNPSTGRSKTLLQYFDNILLRPQQVALVDTLLTRTPGHGFVEVVAQAQMGDGKTKVVSVLEALDKPDGLNLVNFWVPRALLSTNHSDLATSLVRFGQKAYRFEFSRSADCSPARLEQMYENFMRIIVARNGIVAPP